MKTSFFKSITVIAAVLVASTAAWGQSATLDMTVWPTAAGWPQVSAGGGSANLNGGLLTLSTPVNGLSGFRAPSGLWAAAAADPGGFEIEAEMRVVSASDPVSAAASITYRNGTVRCIVDIFEDRIELSSFTNWSGTTTHAMDTTDGFHQYIVSGLGNQVAIKVDGVTVINATTPDSDTGAAVMDFGDEYWTNAAVTEWVYFGFGPMGAVDSRTAVWGDVKAMYR